MHSKNKNALDAAEKVEPVAIDGLLPCPFCGGEAGIERYGDHRASTIYECGSCGCRLETGEEFNHGFIWNTRRTAPPTTDSELRAAAQAVVENWRTIGVCGGDIDRLREALKK